MEYNVIEKFISINGEGLHSGQLAVFIRFFGCNLRCAYCDSKYSYDKDEKVEVLTEQEIIDYLATTGIKNVTLTGGEPLIQKGIAELIEHICNEGYDVEIETNGTQDISQLSKLECRPSFTLDYKTHCAGSDLYKAMKTENYQYLTKADCVKFVVADQQDMEDMRKVCEDFKLLEKTNVFVSPCFGQIPLPGIVAYMQSHKLNGVRMQIQLHKVVWDAAARGV